ncbi:ATP-binding protein, partial [Streptomyces avermitilis]|uniref:ATP-binding protein n=1 Tax=Streptomyces avermitilis TaxID=33903 RepID=UPI0033D65595
RMLGQRARPVRRAGTGKPALETVHGVSSPTQHIPFEPEAANLFFQLISGRYEHASVIVTSNKPFGRWGEVFGDDTVAAAMIDRLVHHADVLSLKGDSYRLKNRDIGRTPSAATG